LEQAQEGLNDFELGLIYTNFSLRLHYSGEAGKEGDAEAIPFEPA
jgi:hypothetical protein